jgi:superfamily II DNA helicase RecQ
VDYQQLLSAPDYAVFVRLRTWRKAIAEKDSVPLYAILTNAQLAEIVQKKCVSMADLQKIEGVAKGRLDKYGGGLLQILTEAAAASQPVAAA